MNRPIKFRVWDSLDREMLFDSDLFFLKLNGTIHFWTGDECLINGKIWPSHLIIQQFTGLLDKNGKEIYEGDIVLVKRNRSTFDESIYEEMKLEVKYLPHKGFKAYWGHNDCNSESLEGSIIIGNINENPDLLK